MHAQSDLTVIGRFGLGVNLFLLLQVMSCDDTSSSSDKVSSSATVTEKEYARLLGNVADRMEDEFKALGQRKFTTQAEAMSAWAELLPTGDLAKRIVAEETVKAGFTAEQVGDFVQKNPESAERVADQFGDKMEAFARELQPAMEKWRQLP